MTDIILLGIIALYVAYCWLKLVLWMRQPLELATFNRIILERTIITIKDLIQRNINIVIMVIGNCLLGFGLYFLISSYNSGIYHSYVHEPLCFAIGALLSINGGIILAKGLREYLR